MHLWSHLALGFHFWGDFFGHSFSFSTCDWSVHNFFFVLVQSWKILLFEEFIRFSQVVHFIGIKLLIVVSYYPLYFCVVYCNFSLFISNFTDLSLLAFFPDKSGYSLVSFVYLLKESAFSFIDLSFVSFISFSFIPSLIYMISFLLLTLGFLNFCCFCFSNCFSCKVRFSIWLFSYFFFFLIIFFLISWGGIALL